MMKRSATALATIWALGLLSCTGEGPTAPEEPASISTIVVTPSSPTLTAIEATRQLEADARDERGRTIEGVSFAWSSSDESVATVDGEGTVTARAVGEATITASAAGRSGAATVTVKQMAAIVEVSPQAASFEAPGDEIQFTATATDANGHPISPAEFHWFSSVPEVVAVDEDGVATAQAPGEARILAFLGLSSGESSVTVPPLHAPLLASLNPDPLVEGTEATLVGENFSPHAASNQVRVDGEPAPVSFASPTEVTFLVPTFDCLPARTVAIEVTVGGTAGSAHQAALRPAVEPVRLAVGEPLLLEDPEDFCLQFEETAAEERYLLGVQSTSTSFATLTRVLLTSVAAAGAGERAAGDFGAGARAGATDSWPSARPPAGGPGGRELRPPEPRWRAHRDAEMELRGWERERLMHRRYEALARRAPAPPEAALKSPTAPLRSGDLSRVRVPDATTSNPCFNLAEIDAVVRTVGTRGIWLEDTGNPSGFTASDFQAMSNRFDGLTYDTNVAYFGEPTDIDGNERVLVVVTREVNRANLLGFVFAGDLFPRTTCPTSDEGEILYLRAPDPAGAVGTPYAVETARKDYPIVVAHEMAHVIQLTRRMEADHPWMSTWMAEAQATLAEEVVGHAHTGRGPGNDYGHAVAFGETGNDGVEWYRNAFVGLKHYFGFQSPTTRVDGAPERCGWLWQNASPCAGLPLWYGVGWSFLRWASDHFGPSHPDGEKGLHRALVDADLNGFENLSAVTGETKERMLAWWAAALYVDGRVTGTDPRLTLPSWNLADIFGNLDPTARLEPVPHSFADFEWAGSIRTGSSRYLRLEGAGRPATSIRVHDTSGPAPPFMRVWLVRLP